MESDIKFEKALSELEKIVADLESGELDLDEALKRYEEGVKLSRACAKKLTETEKKIEVLTDALNHLGDVEVSLEDGSSAKKVEKKKSKKNAKSSTENSGDDFLL